MYDFVFLEEQPVITAVQDSLGNNALLGDSLTNSASISIVSETVPKAKVYFAGIHKNAQAFKTYSSKTGIFTEISLEPGAYSVRIHAQAQQGDILFNSDDYYQVSESSSAYLSFTVE